jgi:hypothetical protein
MENLVKDVLFSVETDCDIVEFTPANIKRDSLSENFLDEINAWARKALAADGFGDY